MLKIQPVSPNLTFKEKLRFQCPFSLYYWTELPDLYFPRSSLFNSAYKGGVNNYQGSLQVDTEKCIQSKCHLCPSPLHGTCHCCTCCRCPIALGPRREDEMKVLGSAGRRELEDKCPIFIVPWLGNSEVWH